MREEERRQEAGDALARAARDSETVGSSALGRLGRRVVDHFGAKDASKETDADPIELWGRRIGRMLSLLGVLVLAYLIGAQLRLW